MNNTLHEVISAAVQDAARAAGMEGSSPPAPLVRVADPTPFVAPRTAPASRPPAEAAPGPIRRLRRRTPAIAANGDTSGNGIVTAKSPDTGSLPARGIQPHVITGTPAVPPGPITAAAIGAAAMEAEVTPVTPPTLSPADASAQLGPGGLRLAFWLCGFHDALSERRRRGETLTDSEELLITLSSADFAGMRPFVVDMTLSRLHAVLNAPDLLDEAKFGIPEPMEVFGLTTLRNLSDRAGQLLRDEGHEAALSLFGESESVLEPLAIFQLVFTAALDLVEAFERMIPGEARLLARLAEALDAEVERI